MTTTTTTNNLIEQVGGIEKAKQLDEMLQKHGIPDEWKISIINGMWHRSSVGFTHNDLRTAIEHHYYGRSEAEELAAYAELSQEKIEGGAMLVGDFSEARKIIDKQLESDHITDITNHISPNTKVINHG